MALKSGEETRKGLKLERRGGSLASSPHPVGHAEGEKEVDFLEE